MRFQCVWSTVVLEEGPWSWRYVRFTMFFRYRRHRDVDDIVSISCQHRYLVIPRLHLRHSDVDDIVSISCQHRYPVIGGLSYLVYIVHIVDIAMLTISCRYRVYIGTLSYLVDIVNIVDIAMLTISCRYRVDIGTLSYLVWHRLHSRHRDVDDIVSISCRHRYPVKPRLHR